MNKLFLPLFLLCAGLILSSEHAFSDFPGDEYYIRAEDLPAPYATPSTSKSAQRVTRHRQMQPIVPSDFEVTLFAENLGHARHLIALPNGDVYLARSSQDVVTRLRDQNKDHVADERLDIPFEFDTPHGLAFKGDLLLVADLEGVWSIDLRNIKTPARRLTSRGVFGVEGGHWTRNIALSPDGKNVYVSIGSRGNVAEEPIPRATIQRFSFTENGLLADQVTYASGLRNPVEISFHPSSNTLYTVVNERDGMGDGLVPDYFTAVSDGDFFGWPYAYSGKLPMPKFAELRPDLVAKSKTPDVLFQSHSAPLGFSFLSKAAVPKGWEDDALVAFHGSWNANKPTGYKVVRVEFKDGHPTGRYFDFMTGFRLNEDQPNARAKVWGRPVGVAVLPDSGILISDDLGGTIWHVAYKPE